MSLVYADLRCTSFFFFFFLNCVYAKCRWVYEWKECHKHTEYTGTCRDANIEKDKEDELMGSHTTWAQLLLILTLNFWNIVWVKQVSHSSVKHTSAQNERSAWWGSPRLEMLGSGSEEQPERFLPGEWIQGQSGACMCKATYPAGTTN